MNFISISPLKSASILALAVSVTALAAPAQASTFTTTSPTDGGTLPGGISPVGGIVLDMIGLNDVRVVSQLSASSLYQGFFNTNPGTIGTQTGFTSALTGALGGGLKQVGIRFSLFDGDTAAGNFDFNENTLLLNGINFGNWSAVNAQNTDASGNAASGGFSGGGFRDNILDTGWFLNSNAATLSSFFTSLVNTQQVVYQIDDVDPDDNFFDFKQGINGSAVNIGTPPVIAPPTAVPEPASLIGILGLGAFGVTTLRKRKQATAVKA